MVNKDRHILSFATLRRLFSKEPSHSIELTVVDTTLARLLALNLDTVSRSIVERGNRTVSLKTYSAGVLLEVLDDFCSGVVSKNNSAKYMTVDARLLGNPIEQSYDTYFIIDSSFVSEHRVVSKLIEQFTLISEEVNKDYNESFKEYYVTKMGRLFREINTLITAVEN